MEEMTKTKSGSVKRILVAALALTLIVLAVLAFLLRDSLSAGGLRRFLVGGEAPHAAGEAFSYEMGSGQVFRLAGDGLAVASGTGLQLLDADGYTAAKQIFALETPAVAASGVLSAFYDVGGTTLRVAWPDGRCESLPVSGDILSVTVNAAGYLAVSTEATTGYKGLVRVYNPRLEPLYEWYSGTGYLLTARVSSDGRSLVASSLTAEGSVLHFFSLGSEDEQARFLAEDELILEFDYLTDGRMAAVTENRLILLDGTGRETSSYDFDGMYLTDYQISGDFATVFLSRYRSGSAGVLVNIGPDGSVLGSLELERDPLSLSAAGRRLLVLYGDGLVLYSQALEEQMNYGDTLGVKSVLLRPRGGALLLSGYSAELLALS